MGSSSTGLPFLDPSRTAIIAALRKANEGTDLAAINQAMEELSAVQHKAAEALYKQSAPGSAPESGASAGDSGGSGAPGGPGGGEDVIDAEVVEDDKNK